MLKSSCAGNRKIIATAAILLWISIESAQAVVIEPMGRALQTLLRTTKVQKKAVALKIKDTGIQFIKGADLYYAKGASGRVATAAFVVNGIYKPDCTHTWAIGINPKNGKVTQVRVIEMSCQHAFPTKSASFLSQFKGKGPADATKLTSQVQTIAKATGSCVLLADAVKESILQFQKIKGSL